MTFTLAVDRNLVDGSTGDYTRNCIKLLAADDLICDGAGVGVGVGVPGETIPMATARAIRQLRQIQLVWSYLSGLWVRASL